MDHQPLDTLTLTDLRRRRSMKWRSYEPDVLPLWVAEMDTPLAPPVAAALHAAIERGDTGYAHPGALAEEYADFAARRFGHPVDPAAASLVPDVMRGIAAILEVVTDPGDGVVVHTPAYPPFFAVLAQTGRKLVESPLRETGDGGYAIDLDRLERDFAGGARAYLLCNPHNPTGAVFDAATLRAVTGLAGTHGVRVLADEIHGPLTYPGVPFTPLLSLSGSSDVAARAFAFVSASKAFNLPGLKAALTLAGPDARDDLARVPVEVSYGTGLLGVLAGEAAFRDGGDWLDALLRDLDRNRALLATLVARALPGVRYRPPDGTYLAWLDCRDLGLGPDPAATFLRDGRVAVNSGSTFGAPGDGFVRLNIATAPEILTEGVRRMAAALHV